MIWFTSDHHFYHKNVIRYCNRPFKSLEEMHEELIRRHNSLVDPSDTVYMLGDISFSGPQGTKKILDRMDGSKILIRGNHDKGANEYFLKHKIYEEIYDSVEIFIANTNVILCHYPYAPTKWEKARHKLRNFWKFWRREKYNELRFMERRPKDQGAWLLHGHVHNAWKTKRKQINVGVDRWDFYPVPLDTIEGIIKAK